MINQCNFIGRLGRDPETRYTNSGKAVASFSIACSEGKGDNERTEWVRVVAWERLAEICGEYLRKGSLVFVSGRMQTRKWQDQNGNDRYTTEVIAREMKMLSSRGEGGSGQQGQGQGGGYEPPPMPPDDDVPF